MLNKKFILLMAGLILFGTIIFFSYLPSVSGELGTFKQGTDIQLIQTCNNCTYCNITAVKYPNSSDIYVNQIMTQDGTYFNFTLNSTYTNTLGWHKYCYDCGNEEEKATGCIDFSINQGGNVMEDGQGFVFAGIFIIIFGIACVFLYLSSKMAGEGLKIFFLLATFVFLIGTVGVIAVIAVDSGLTSGMSSMVSVMLYAVSIITILMFFYVLIRQTVNALNLFKLNKGYASYNDDLW